MRGLLAVRANRINTRTKSITMVSIKGRSTAAGTVLQPMSHRAGMTVGWVVTVAEGAAGMVEEAGAAAGKPATYPLN